MEISQFRVIVIISICLYVYLSHQIQPIIWHSFSVGDDKRYSFVFKNSICLKIIPSYHWLAFSLITLNATYFLGHSAHIFLVQDLVCVKEETIILSIALTLCQHFIASCYMCCILSSISRTRTYESPVMWYAFWIHLPNIRVLSAQTWLHSQFLFSRHGGSVHALSILQLFSNCLSYRIFNICHRAFFALYSFRSISHPSIPISSASYYSGYTSVFSMRCARDICSLSAQSIKLFNRRPQLHLFLSIILMLAFGCSAPCIKLGKFEKV